MSVPEAPGRSSFQLLKRSMVVFTTNPQIQEIKFEGSLRSCNWHILCRRFLNNIQGIISFVNIAACLTGIAGHIFQSGPVWSVMVIELRALEWIIDIFFLSFVFILDG